MANEGEKLIFLLSIREPGPENTPEGASYAEVGTLATVRVIEREEDVVRVVLDGLRRAIPVKAVRWLHLAEIDVEPPLTERPLTATPL